jgi:hypothetical protein
MLQTRDCNLPFNPLNAELNHTRHLLALVGARHIVHVSRIRVKMIWTIYYTNNQIWNFALETSSSSTF